MKRTHLYPVDTIIDKLKEFLALPEARNLWLECADMKVYVRRSYRAFGIKSPDSYRHNCLDIASIEIAEKHRGKKFFSEFMRQASELNPYSALYLEQVTNPVLHAYCRNHGWTVDPNAGADYKNEDTEGDKSYFIMNTKFSH